MDAQAVLNEIDAIAITIAPAPSAPTAPGTRVLTRRPMNKKKLIVTVVLGIALALLSGSIAAIYVAAHCGDN
jgi:hypothetical protein